MRTLWNTLHTNGVHALDSPPPPGGINISLSAGEAHALDDVVHLLRDIHSLAGAAAGIDAALALTEERHANAWKHHRLMCAVRDRRQAILGH